jgi:tRNA(His) 5'-end guanylyltransferase
MIDNLGDRMKVYEQLKAGERFIPMCPVCVRMDGKCFHNYTKGLKRPYDKSMSMTMLFTTERLVKESGALIGYTQSDEISLIFYSDRYDSQIFFDGKIQKLISVLSSMVTVYFNDFARQYLPPVKRGYLALFDCRAWQVPNKEEAANVILWRELDAVKNSISMSAREFYSHKELLNKTGKQMQEMLFEKGVNWNDYPSFFKRGSFIQKRVCESKFTPEAISKLPEKHNARKNPDLVYKRTEIRQIDMPSFNTVTNRVGVIFNGECPEVKRVIE